jgi:hypothetical protein
MVKLRNETYRFHFPMISDPETCKKEKKKETLKNVSSQKKKKQKNNKFRYSLANIPFHASESWSTGTYKTK